MNFFKGKGKKAQAVDKAPEPRAIAEIQKEYQQVALNAGAAQYQAMIHGEEVKNRNKRLLQLNQEAAQRQALDKQAADAQQKEKTNEKPA